MIQLLIILTGLIIPVEPGASLQNALDGSFPGDTVLALPGEHLGTGANLILLTGQHNGVTLLGDISAPETVVFSGNGLSEGIVKIEGQTNGPVDSSTVIAGITFHSGNSGAEPFGGALYSRHSSVLIEHCAFTDCDADNGGAVYVWKGAPILRNCVFQNNESVSAGGGVYLYSSDAVIKHCRFTDNRSRDDGGGLFCYHSSPVVFNCLFNKDQASDDGGGVYCYAFSNPVVSFCTFTENFSLNTGSAVYFRVNSSPVISHCIVTENDGPAFYIQDGGSPVFQYNCVWGNPDGNYGNLPDPTGTEGNISLDPLLTGDNYLSQTAAGQPENSPCVNAGNGTPIEFNLELTWTRTDSIPDSSAVDMGYHHGFGDYLQTDPQGPNGLELLVYPNPASASITVALPDQEQWNHVRLLDLSGRVLHTVEPEGFFCTVNASQIRHTGLYLVQASGNGITLTKPVTVIR